LIGVLRRKRPDVGRLNAAAENLRSVEVLALVRGHVSERIIAEGRVVDFTDADPPRTVDGYMVVTEARIVWSVTGELSEVATSSISSISPVLLDLPYDFAMWSIDTVDRERVPGEPTDPKATAAIEAYVASLLAATRTYVITLAKDSPLPAAIASLVDDDDSDENDDLDDDDDFDED
jgi:hypothetical protein